MPSTTKPDIHRLIAFHDLLHQFQAIERATYVPESKQHDNDTEHSYNLAMMAWFLASYFPSLDRDKLIRFAMAHDLVEIHAGDTYVFADAATLASKEAREAEALVKLEQDWPDFPDLIHTIHEYEKRDSDEACFVYALDKLMPVMVNALGEGYGWRKEGINLAQLHAIKKDKVKLSPAIDAYYQQLYALLLENQHWFPSAQTTKSN